MIEVILGIFLLAIAFGAIAGVVFFIYFALVFIVAVLMSFGTPLPQPTNWIQQKNPEKPEPMSEEEMNKIGFVSGAILIGGIMVWVADVTGFWFWFGLLVLSSAILQLISTIIEEAKMLNQEIQNESK